MSSTGGVGDDGDPIDPSKPKTKRPLPSIAQKKWVVPQGSDPKGMDFVATGPHRFVISEAELRGIRDTMEDAFCIHDFQLSPQHHVTIIGVFDGHGGKYVSTWLAKKMPDQLENSVKKMYKRRGDLGLVAGISTALRDGFMSLDSLLRQDRTTNLKEQGSTACVVLVLNDVMVWTAHCGDTRAVAVSTAGKGQAITKDHKPNSPSELLRISGLGGRVTNEDSNIARVQGVLSVSRAFGDFLLTPFVS